MSHLIVIGTVGVESAIFIIGDYCLDVVPYRLQFLFSEVFIVGSFLERQFLCKHGQEENLIRLDSIAGYFIPSLHILVLLDLVCKAEHSIIFVALRRNLIPELQRAILLHHPIINRKGGERQSICIIILECNHMSSSSSYHRIIIRPQLLVILLSVMDLMFSSVSIE